ncbi:MAG: phage portal protein [Oscillospiraceae bacterium]|nr:phage portal protein [Oscillospiraceae bacterium]
MSFKDMFKSLFNGLKKGGESMDDTADIAKIATAVSGTMQTATKLWWDAFRRILPQEPTHKNFKPLPIAYVSTAYLAQLVTGEIKFQLPDERLNGFVQKNLLPNLDRITQLTLAGGYTAIKPYITASGEVFFDFGTSRDFLPIALDENGHITEGTFFERIRYRNKVYERREHHCFANGVHRVTNTAWICDTHRRIELNEIPRWAALMPQGEIPSDIPMIATFRTPYANNIDLDSELPISMYANSLDTLHEIDAAHSEYLAEFRKMRAKVFADGGVFDARYGKITDDYFVSVDGDGVKTMEQQIMTYAPQIREDAHKAAINTELRLYEVQIGVSNGTFTFDSQKGLVTATQVLSEDKTTYNTVCQLQRQLKPVLESLAQITANLARFYGFEVTDGEPGIEFGDSVFEDTGTEFNRRMQMVQAGLLKPEYMLTWYFGVPEETAREMMAPMSQTFGGDE